MYICACVGLCDMCVCVLMHPYFCCRPPQAILHTIVCTVCVVVCVRGVCVCVCVWVCVWIHDADNAGSMCECVYRTKYVCGVREGASVVVCVRARVCVTACDAVRL
jgi:hypothetical protein